MSLSAGVGVIFLWQAVSPMGDFEFPFYYDMRNLTTHEQENPLHPRTRARRWERLPGDVARAPLSPMPGLHAAGEQALRRVQATLAEEPSLG
jgi:hypothetical protein